MSVLAAIRPDDWNFPLLLHVVGAMLLVGGLLTAVTALILGWRRDSPFYARLGFWTLLVVALPSWILMRVGAQLIYDKWNFDEDDEPGWVGIGWITAEPGLLVLLISIVLTGVGARRLRRSEGGTSVLVRIGAVFATLLLVAYLVAVWAMTAKPD